MLLYNSEFASRNLSNFDANMNLPRHRWYNFKEGFTAALVREAITSVRSNGFQDIKILDPFGGSGTTSVVAAESGYNVQSIEVNPFLAFVAKCKTIPLSWSYEEFIDARKSLLAVRGSKRSSLEGISTLSESSPTGKWLFNNKVLRTYTSLMNVVKKYDSGLQDVLKLGIIAAIMETCNARKDGKCLRYKRNWRQLNYGRTELLHALDDKLQQIFEDINIEPLSEKPSPIITNGDCRRVLEEIGKETVDLIVTSPPYLNSFDYSDVYRPELYLSGHIQNNIDLRQIRLQTLRSHVQVNWERSNVYNSRMLKMYISQLEKIEDLWDKRIPEMVQAYFDDMLQCLRNLHRICSVGGQIWLVVSTSAYGGIQIPVDLLLAEIGEEVGLRLDGVHVLRSLRSSGQHWRNQSTKPPLRESLIIWRKP